MTKVYVFIAIVIIGVFFVLILQNNEEVKGIKALTNPNLPTGQLTPIQQMNQNQQNQQSQQNQQPQQVNEKATVEEPPPQDIVNMASVSATIKTSKGDIELTLYNKDAPKTVKNFMDKAKSNFYNNLTFHRVEDWVVQGGDPKGDGTGGGNMPVEFNSKPFVVGSLGVASRGDGKVQNDAQFFITKKEASWLNNQYTNFGIVTKGMDVVEKMAIGDKILGITIQ